MEYTGGRTENEIVNWILKKVGPPSTAVDCAGLKDKVENNKLVLAYFGEESDAEFKNFFIDLSGQGKIAEKFVFLNTNDKDCAAGYGASLPGLVLFRKFESNVNVYEGAMETKVAMDWISGMIVPTLIEFDEDYIEPIFGERNDALILFRPKADENGPIAKTFEEAANSLKKEILFVVSDAKEGIQAKLSEFVGVEADKLPAMLILSPKKDMKKYRYEGSLDGLTTD